jgi:predicted PurR-regulated permease PerM
MNETPHSPTWGPTVKLVVGLTFVAVIAAFLVRFRSLIAPLLVVFILSYLLHPVIARLEKATPLSWKVSTGIVFFIVLIIFLAGTAGAGVVVVNQFQSLIRFFQTTLVNFPEIAQEFITRQFEIGAFTFSLSEFFDTENVVSMAQQLLDYTQPVLGRAGSLLSVVATGTVTTLAWVFFILIASFFILSDLGETPDILDQIDIPGFNEDIERLALELSRIWNAFVRGQTILILLTFVLYWSMLGILGLRYALAIALLAGLSRLIPYVGAWITWITIILVSLFQSGNYFGLVNWQYMILVLIVGMTIDGVFDNFIAPQILGESLGINPALILIGALIAANLIGIVGVFLAAPVLVTLRLFGQYALRKMLDQDPFPTDETEYKPVRYPWVTLAEKAWPWIKPRLNKIWSWLKPRLLNLWRNLKSVIVKDRGKGDL